MLHFSSLLIYNLQMSVLEDWLLDVLDAHELPIL